LWKERLIPQNKEGECTGCVEIKYQKYLETEQKLLNLIEVIEEEEKALEWGVAPWPYEELANLYNARKDFRKEVAILERFAARKHAPGQQAAQLLERLHKAK
jgi:hypothetical protein